MIKNLYGNTPYLNFWLKGTSANDARGFIYLESKKHTPLPAILRTIPKKYTFSLDNDIWQLMSIPIREEDLKHLSKTTRYYIYIFSDNSNSEGKFFIDNFFISYTPVNYSIPSKRDSFTSAKRDNNKIILNKAPKTILTPRKRAIMSKKGSSSRFIDLPDLKTTFHPSSSMARGNSYSTKVSVPKDISVKSITGMVEGTKQKLVLVFKETTLTGTYKAQFKIPKNFTKGYQFATIYIETIGGQLYRKKLPLQILLKNPSLLDLISVHFGSHPLKVAREIPLKLNIPKQLNSVSVVIFLGDAQNNIEGIKLTKSSSYNKTEQWRTNIVLPTKSSVGDYRGIIYIKDKNGKSHKKTFIYSVSQ